MIDRHHFRTLIIQPTLVELGMWDKNIEELMIATMAYESDGGANLSNRDFSRLGVYCCDIPSFVKTWQEEVVQAGRSGKVMMACNLAVAPLPKELINNLKLATIICRLYYHRIKEPVPDSSDIEAIAKYWHMHYSAEPEEAIENFIYRYKKYVKVKSRSKLVFWRKRK